MLLLTMTSLIGCEKTTEYVEVQKEAVYPDVGELMLAEGLGTSPGLDRHASNNEELLRLDNEIRMCNERYTTLHNQFPKKVD